MLLRVIGAGVMGLAAAFEMARQGRAAGVRVEIVERQDGVGLGCSFFAGGMIAPWCELESAEPIVAELGEEALDFWTRELPRCDGAGSLVVAPARDRAELADFARRTRHFEERRTQRGLAALEPDLAGRFDAALFFPTRSASRAARRHGRARRAPCSDGQCRRSIFGVDAAALATSPDWTIDCRGFAARDALPGLRGVKGEMLILRSDEISPVASGAHAASAPSGLCRAARRWRCS